MPDFTRDQPIKHYAAKVLGAIILAQLVYWLLLAPISQVAPLGSFERIEAVEVAPISTPTLQTARATPPEKWQSKEIFWFDCCDQEYFAFRYQIPLDNKPERDLGLIAGFGADNHHIWVNGYPLLDRGKLESPASYSKWTKGVLRVSHAMLRQGDNEVLVITKRNNGGYTDLFPQTYGDYADMSEAAARRSFFINDYRIATMIIVGFVSLLALLLVPISKNRAFAFWLAMLAGSLSLRIAHVRWEDWPLSSQAYLVWYFILTNLAALSWFCFVDAWGGRSHPWISRIMMLMFAAVTVAISVAIHRDQNPGFDLASTLTDLFLAFSAIAAAILFLWRLVRYPSSRYLEIGIFTVGIVAMLMDGAGKFFSVWWSGSNLQYALPILVFGLVASVLGRNIRVYESMGAFNDELNQKLARSKEDMEERYHELQQAQRARDIAEDRQRILRDMHDGIGSQLTGLLVEARAGNAQPSELQHGIENSLNDLRLVVDSLDNFGDSFGAAMASLKPRIQRQLAAADIQLDWQMDISEEPLLSSRDVLQIARIVQEAVTNIIRHSNASSARIAISAQGSRESITVEIADNGIFGGDASNLEGGHGIGNLRQRAEALGGTISFEPAKPGLLVRLSAPT